MNDPMDFNGMLKQFRTIRKMAPIKDILKGIPGLGGHITDDALELVSDKEISRIEAIILSMTPQERREPDLLDVSRRQRIANGSGTSLRDVANLCGQLHQMRRGMRR